MNSKVAKTETSKSPQAKRWCYTLNNPKQPIAFNELTQLYHVYGEEVGESGTPHYQGFIVFKNLKRLSQLKEINCHAHWEVARGTNKEASDYCKKDGKFHEFGELPPERHVKGNKANSDKWRNISDHAKAGDLKWIDENYPKPFVNSYRNLVAIKKDFTKRLPDLNDVCGVWYTGEAGVGKTRLITKLYPDAYLKRMNKWFDGYNNEEVVVIDDLDPSHAFMGYELKKLADRYCYMVEVKNASMYIRPKRVVVTSQYTIEQIWKDDKKTQAALLRRFKVVNVTKDNISLLMQVSDNINKAFNEESSDEEEEKEEHDTPVILSDEEMDEEELALIEEIEREHIAKKQKVYDEINEKIDSIPIDLTRLPNKLKPANEYYPDKPIKFGLKYSPNQQKLKKKLRKKLERKHAMRPTLHEVYSLECNEDVDFSDDPDVPNTSSFEEIVSEEDF